MRYVTFFFFFNKNYIPLLKIWGYCSGGFLLPLLTVWKGVQICFGQFHAPILIETASGDAPFQLHCACLQTLTAGTLRALMRKSGMKELGLPKLLTSTRQSIFEMSQSEDCEFDQCLWFMVRYSHNTDS